MRVKLHSIVLAGLCGMAVMSPAPAWQTQPEGNTSVGPAEIRDFSLPGTTPVPEREPEPSPAPTPSPAEPREELPAEPEPAAPAAEPVPAPTTETARPTPAAPRQQRDDPPEQRLPAPSAVDETSADPPTNIPEPTPSPAAEPVPAQIAPRQAADDGASSGWLLPILGALAILGGALAFLRLRRRRTDEEPELELTEPVQPQPLPVPDPEPVAIPALGGPAPVSDVPGIVMRPWLELVFRPAKASATDGGASVQYEAVIRNNGNAPARNVRLAACMFNSGQDIQSEVSRFFAMGIDAPDGAPLTILPRTEIVLSSVVNMAREDMREIKLQGRSLFIPTVAFNLLYEWGRDKLGQTCSAHVVGREPDPPAEKMAPFRLDLGPRVYRSVGQRPSALARAV